MYAAPSSSVEVSEFWSEQDAAESGSTRITILWPNTSTAAFSWSPSTGAARQLVTAALTREIAEDPRKRAGYSFDNYKPPTYPSPVHALAIRRLRLHVAPAPDCRLSPGSRAPDARSIDRSALALRPPFSSSSSFPPATAADSLQTRNAYVLSVYPRSLPAPASSCDGDPRCPALQASRSPLHIDIPSHPPLSSSVPSLVQPPPLAPPAAIPTPSQLFPPYPTYKSCARNHQTFLEISESLSLLMAAFVRRPCLFLSLSLCTLSARPPFPRRCRLPTLARPVLHTPRSRLSTSHLALLVIIRPFSIPLLLPGLSLAPAPSRFPVVPSPSLLPYLSY
ncbi:hypothetical protein B0H14DRAFT_3868862 [Mycena olivaceomarginata]|nr:hypothetical protein B0H14DRAFT_3868862 [Mycena olivaceomarginata]